MNEQIKRYKHQYTIRGNRFGKQFERYIVIETIFPDKNSICNEDTASSVLNALELGGYPQDPLHQKMFLN